MILKRRRSCKSFRCDGKVDESVLRILLSVLQSTLVGAAGMYLWLSAVDMCSNDL